MFSLPSEFVASTSEMIAQSFLDLKLPIILGLGVSIGFEVIKKGAEAIKRILGK